jgi:hypothetical protein
MLAATMPSPYANLPPRGYWRTGVSEQEPGFVEDLYRKRFTIDRSTRVAASGSCFAQHIARNLRRRGYTVLDAEPPPPGLTQRQREAYGYGTYSARYGNVYTARQMLQLAQEALGERPTPEIVWAKGDRYCDALRPSVEPDGLSSLEEVLAHRADHLPRVAKVLEDAEVLVFTLGLTEAWADRRTGTVYPTAPETVAGTYDPEAFVFTNATVSEVASDLRSLRSLVRSINPDARFLLTVSPVPLTATASGQHVLPATVYSKSVLRAAAGEICAEHDDVDYFPAYEIVSTPFLRQEHFERNLRSVSKRGVDCVMRHFFFAHDDGGSVQSVAQAPAAADDSGSTAEELVCEDALLEAFAP